MPQRRSWDVAQCDCLAIRQAARQITQLYERHLSNDGLKAGQYAILRKLSVLGSTSIGDLAHSMVMDATSVTRAIKLLQRDGLVGVSGADDLRTRLVHVTGKGRTKLRAANVSWRKAQDQFERAFGASEARQLRRTMLRVVESMDA